MREVFDAMTPTLTALAGFIAWALLLLITMEVIRSKLVLTGVTDALAPVLLGARIVQSTIHLASTAPAAVTARFVAFSVQMAIAAYWAFALLAG
ncbi:MAG: hypothetical protein ACNA8J_10675 [Gammaproteobacteria bacterium]